MNKTLREIAEKTRLRYSQRYHEKGYNVRTLGWGSTEQQLYRFEQTLSLEVELEDKRLLDLGCGFGDYLDFLLGSKIRIQNYTGWDLNPDLIEKAQEIHQSAKGCEFVVKDLTTEDQPTSPGFDIGVMLGVLNFNLHDTYDNVEFSKLLIKQMFSQVSEVLIVDFLSAHRYSGYPKEDFVFYHDPMEMMEFALSLTDNVVLKHDYLPIPQKEFMLALFKNQEA